MTTGGNEGLNKLLLRVVRGAIVVDVVVVVILEVRANGLRRVVIVTDRCVVEGALARAPENGGRRLNSGLLLRREFSVVVVIGSWLSPSMSSDGSSVTKVVSNSSGSGVVCVDCVVDFSREAVGRIRLRLIDGRTELEAIRLLMVRELRSGGRRAPPSDDVGKILGVSEDRDGRMLEVG